MVRTLFLVLCMAILSVSFNNCGRVLPGGGLSSGVISLGSSLGKGACLSELKAVYATSYHSYFRNKCSHCHQHQSSHASADLNVSYQAFVDKGQITLGDRILTPHGPGYTPSPTAAADVAMLKSTWDPAQAKYESCVASSPVGGGTSIGDIALLGKVVPNLNATRSNGTTFVTVSWNVASETEKSADANKLNATFSVQVALILDPASARGTAAIQGLYFKNPTLQLNGITGPVSINDLGLVIEDEEMTQFTIWKNGVLATVSGTAPVNMAAGLGTGYSYKAGLTTTSKVAFKLKGLVIGGGTAGGGASGGGGSVTGPTTTFTELNSSNATKNVFARTCNSCHSPGGSAGLVLDLTNYTDSQGSTAQILQRINNGSMPPGQPLSNADRSQVQSWVDGGAPQ